MRHGRTSGAATGTGRHVGQESAARYADGTASGTAARSLEKHIEICGACAARVSSAVRARGAATTVLADVRAAVLTAALAEAGGARETRGAGGVVGAARMHDRAAVPPVPPTTPVPPTAPTAPTAPIPKIARILWAAGPALRGPWLLALVLVAVGAVVLAYGAGLGAAARPLLFLTAPVLPLAGVVVSYGRHADPLHEIAASTPSGGVGLLLTRSAAVLGVSIPALTCAGALLPASAGGPGAAAWLLPGLAMTLAALALGSYIGCRAGASVVAAGWTAAVVLPTVGAAPGGAALVAWAAPYFAGPGIQGCWAAGALVCAALIAVRRRSFDHLETL
ncbi:zf-HC2 domain-containing protein [Streptomyces sp. NBC_01433]|uniref:zf-HC2 domain-containing protein n=1 Tax=Streptomyces sp. NBC_01433 TaxID=2903864 RepID=UPI00224D1A22|nr:zf-HC2 domain-containing protein [Streptomyces sp. NBC_01433]MCX4674292.1 zf-HC2 domain-containing protein [Streptomyces sp. NBC_01433]